MTSANLVAEIQFKFSIKRALSTGEPCAYEHITLFQSFHRVTLSIQWYIPLPCPFYLDALLRQPCLAGS